MILNYDSPGVLTVGTVTKYNDVEIRPFNNYRELVIKKYSEEPTYIGSQ